MTHALQLSRCANPKFSMEQLLTFHEVSMLSMEQLLNLGQGWTAAIKVMHRGKPKLNVSLLFTSAITVKGVFLPATASPA